MKGTRITTKCHERSHFEILTHFGTFEKIGFE